MQNIRYFLFNKNKVSTKQQWFAVPALHGTFGCCRCFSLRKPQNLRADLGHEHGFRPHESLFCSICQRGKKYIYSKLFFQKNTPNQFFLNKDKSTLPEHL